MSKRINYQEVVECVNNISQGETLLLSKEYINNKSPLLFQCSCGNVFERSFAKFKLGRTKCQECNINVSHEKQKTSFDFIKSEIEKNGCKYISGDYVNCRSKLYLQCHCGNYFYKSWNTFKRGQNHCVECGKKSIADFQRKYYPQDIKQILLRHNYQMIGNYVDCKTPIDCICEKGHQCSIILSELISPRHKGCQQCSLERRSGINHYNYKGGISLLDNVIRQNLSDWKTNIRNLYNHECPITHATNLNTVVHHLYSLNSIIKEVMDNEKINFQSFKQINKIKLSDNDLERFISEVVKKHTNKMGILIDKDIHKAFHKQYGYGNNTPEQFDNFLKDNYSISLSQILKE